MPDSHPGRRPESRGSYPHTLAQPHIHSANRQVSAEPQIPPHICCCCCCCLTHSRSRRSCRLASDAGEPAAAISSRLRLRLCEGEPLEFIGSPLLPPTFSCPAEEETIPPRRGLARLLRPMLRLLLLRTCESGTTDPNDDLPVLRGIFMRPEDEEVAAVKPAPASGVFTETDRSKASLGAGDETDDAWLEKQGSAFSECPDCSSQCSRRCCSSLACLRWKSGGVWEAWAFTEDEDAEPAEARRLPGPTFPAPRPPREARRDADEESPWLPRRRWS